MKNPLTARERRGLILLATVTLMLCGGVIIWKGYLARRNVSYPERIQHHKQENYEDVADKFTESDSISNSETDKSVKEKKKKQRNTSGKGGKRNKKESRHPKPAPRDPFEPVPVAG